MRIINRIDPSYQTLEKEYDIDVVILNDVSAIADDDNANAVAWLNESPDIIEACWGGEHTGSFHSVMVEKLKSGNHLFKTLYTFDRRYDGLPNVVIVPPAIPSWVNDSESDVYPKTKKCTMITSTKQYTPVQEKRVDLAKSLDRMSVPVYGTGWLPSREIGSKTETLKPYMYCFVVENGIYSGYHTEKILDCFRTGTVPIYYGDPDINKVFNLDGIIVLENLEIDLDQLLPELTKERYEYMLPAIRENFQIAMRYNYLATDVIDMILKDIK
mgnify:FL=1